MDRPTLVARRMMRTFGAISIFTNKYEHCRTVKCYSGQITYGPEFRAALKDAMEANGTPDYTVEQIYRAVIVRIPL